MSEDKKKQKTTEAEARETVHRVQFVEMSNWGWDRGSSLIVAGSARCKDFRHDEHFVWFTFDKRDYKIPMAMVQMMYMSPSIVVP